MIIKPDVNAKDLWEIGESIGSNVLIYQVREDIALPWDAEISVSGNIVTITGSIAGGQGNRPEMAGYCECRCTTENFPNFYKLDLNERAPEIKEEFGDESGELDIFSLKDMLESNGWIVVK